MQLKREIADLSDKSVQTHTVDGKRNTWTRMGINKQQGPLKCPKQTTQTKKRLTTNQKKKKKNLQRHSKYKANEILSMMIYGQRTNKEKNSTSIIKKTNF